MEVSEALELFREKKEEEPTPIPEKKYDKKADYLIYVKAAVAGFFILWILYAFLVNPIDKLMLKASLIDNYAITVKGGGRTGETLVDGNVIYTAATYYEGEKYYEIVGDERYIYYKDLNDKWVKKKDTLYRGENGDLPINMVDLLDKDNYKRPLLFFKPMEYTKATNSLGLKNVTFRYFAGRAQITGEIHQELVIRYVTIEITNFGTVDLELPEATLVK